MANVRDNMNIPGMRRPGNRFAATEKADHVGATLVRIAKYLSKETIMLVGMFTAVILDTLCGIFAPALQSQAIDIIAGSRNGVLLMVLSWMLGVYLLSSLSSFLQSLISAHVSQRFVRRMRGDLFDKFTDLPIRYLDTHSHGDLMSRMTNDIENISNTVSQSLASMISGVLTLIGTVFIMFWYCWQLALISCTTVILTVIATKFVSGQVRKYSRRRQELLGQLNGTVEEMVTGFKTVVAYQHQEETIEAFEKTSDDLTRAGILVESLGGGLGPVMNCLSNLGFVLIAAFGGYFAINGLISVGVIAAFIVYAKQFSRPISQLAQVYGQLQTAVAGAERIFLVLDEAEETDHGTETIHPGNSIIAFQDVNFSYRPEQQVLHNFSLTIPAGKKIALVGATGSGKTTVVNLLMRYYDIDSGEITVNGTNIRNIALSNLRKQTAIVLQDTVLFSDTIRRNITYSNENATPQQLEAALEISSCKEMIALLPDGLDTMLSESGSNLSQGQRQLLSIARAFLADPSILILDEATSNVDTRTEKRIQDAMVALMKSRTSIVIAHRLSTIQDADEIVVMDQGRIVETGTHEALLKQHGKYYELYMTQFAGIST